MQRAIRIPFAPDETALAYHEPEWQREIPMPRANLVSLMELFAKFGGDAAVVQRRGYRREKRTYGELHADAILWSFALGRKGVEAGDRGLLCGANSADGRACVWATALVCEVGVT